MAQGQTLRLYNTLSRSKEDFVPIDPANVRMYVCGPTVYDYAHIGNARPAIVFDLLFRLLRHVYGESHVTYVRNITDVDDKINARAARDFPDVPLNDAIRRLTETTAAQYQKDVTALGCLPPTVQPRATDFVLPRPDGKADMASLIQNLIERGHAYAANDEILFDTASMADYGRLSQRRLEDQQAGARIAVDAHKKNPEDFVLWKGSSAGEPGWPATFRLPEGERTIHGRPGWHIECSAMSAAYLGEVFDIHGGGLDLIFPHHENEIAQSRCAHGTEVMAKVWMHNGFLQVEGKKMSKSEGNFVTIHELLETEKFGGRKWPGEVLRLAMLMTHYREPIDFSVARLHEATNVRLGWLGPLQRRGIRRLGSVDKRVVAALCDDLDTNGARLALDALAREAKEHFGSDAGRELTNNMAATLAWLGLASDVDFEVSETDDHHAKLSVMAAMAGLRLNDIDEMVEARLAALNAKNFAEADRIRAELLTQGVQLMDFKDPATGERRTRWELKR